MPAYSCMGGGRSRWRWWWWWDVCGERQGGNGSGGGGGGSSGKHARGHAIAEGQSCPGRMSSRESILAPQRPLHEHAFCKTVGTMVGGAGSVSRCRPCHTSVPQLTISSDAGRLRHCRRRSEPLLLALRRSGSATNRSKPQVQEPQVPLGILTQCGPPGLWEGMGRVQSRARQPQSSTRRCSASPADGA